MFKSKVGRLEKQIKQGQRDNRRTQRELERDRAQLQRDEAQIKAEIKKLAKQGNKDACAILAKQLIKNREQRNRTYEFGARMDGITSQQNLMKSNLKVANAAKTSTAVMSKMNAQISNADTAKVMKEFQKQSMKMSLTEEAMDDALSSVFDDNEEEEDAVVRQVLDELGIETASKLAGAPNPSSSTIGAAATNPGQDTEEIEAQLDRLRGI